MTAVALAEIADQIRGVSYGKADVVDRPADGFLPVLRANNIKDDGLSFDDLVYVRAEKVSAKQQVRSGDIVIAASSGSISVVGKAAQADDDLGMGFGAFCKVVRPSPKVHARYIGHFFKTQAYRRKMSALAAGANINNLKNEHIDEIEIPLPPLDEQKRIAAILDQLDELRRKRQRAIDRLGQLGQAIFHEMFEGAEPYPTKEIADFADVKGGKRLPKGAEYLPEPSPHPYIRVSDLNGVGIDLERLKYISPETHSAVRRYIVHSGDVIISIAGTIGVTAAVPKFLDGANLTENAAKITPKRGVEFDPAYVAWALRMPTSRSQILASTGQVTIGKLALFRIEKIAIPMPDIEHQRAFSNAIAKIDISIADYQRHLCKMERLFASLQHSAFQGEL